MTRSFIFSAFLFACVTLNSAVKHVPTVYSTIQSALNACALGDTVLVQPGTYIGNILWPKTLGIKLLSAGDSSNTILNANNSGRTLTRLGQNGTMADTAALVRGFTITGADINGSGGGVWVLSAGMRFEGTAITRNGAIGYGGGVYGEEAHLIFKNCAIVRNTIHNTDRNYGGGITIQKGTARFEHVKINENYAIGAIWLYGIGLYADQSRLTFHHTEISRNSSDKGATWKYGGGMYVQDCNITASDVSISENFLNSGSTWYHGGGLYIRNSAASFTNLAVVSNALSYGGDHYSGGGIYLWGDSAVKIVNGLIALNSLDTGAVYYYGGGIYVEDDMELQLMNTTIALNRGTAAQGIYGSGVFAAGITATVHAVNSIFYDPNQESEIDFPPGTPVQVTYSNIRGAFPGTGNIAVSPGFVSLSDLHLDAGSPCINSATSSGAPAFDIGNYPRPFGGAYDMGCYEYNPTAGLRSVPQVLQGLETFPNPAGETCVIRFFAQNIGDGVVILTDASGKEVFTRTMKVQPGLNTITCNLEASAGGLYLCRILTTQGSASVKLIKQ